MLSLEELDPHVTSRRTMNTMHETNEPLYTVGEVAQHMNVTVRTLHHWESLGLISPTERSWLNYRLYAPQDLERIQQILIYRGTGMKLSDIKQLLAHNSSNLTHLRRQRERLIEQKTQLETMLQAIDKLIGKEMHKQELSLTEIGEILGNAKFAEYQAEAEQTYGDTDDWTKSQQQTAHWSASNWTEHKQRFNAIDEQLAEAVRSGIHPHSEKAASLVAAHREVLSAFFPVTPAKHYLISRSYITDERFTNYYENQQEGLAQWLADAISHAAETNGVDLDNPKWG